MKNQLIGWVFAALWMLSVGVKASDDKEVKIKTSAICEMCKGRIERNLAFEKGIKESNLDLETKIITVKYNPKKTDITKIKAIISKTGYDADDVAADEKGYNKLPDCCRKTSKVHTD